MGDECLIPAALEQAQATGSSTHKKLEGKVAIITGAASGIGEASAKMFAKGGNGARVIVADIQDELGQQVCKEIGPNAHFVHCDVSKESDVQSAVDLAVKKWGHLDVMFNNPAILSAGPERPLHELDMGEFDCVMDVNVRGTMMGTKHAARVMIPKKKGAIINVASAVAVLAGKLMPPYVVSKHAVVGITKNAAASLGEHCVRVNCISPFAVATPLHVKWVQSFRPGATAEDFEKMFAANAVLQGHQLKADDIARAALFLASNDSAYVNGHNLVVDGGFTTSK